MIKPLFFGIALSLALPTAGWTQSAPAAATQQQAAAAGKFVDSVANEAFAILRDKAMSREESRAKFRTLLRENFALDEAGLRLIRRHRANLTPQQLANYRAALPDFLINTYSDRLYDFAEARVSIVRTVPRGSRGDVDVYSKVSDPGGGRPIDAIWTIKTSGPRMLIQNLTVSGVNVALTQEADFNAYIERNGFDALINFMRQTK